MPCQQFDVPVPTSVAAGAFVGVQDLTDKWVAIHGTFSATVQLQWSPDGQAASAVNVGAAATAPGAVQIGPNGGFVRANVTAFTSGVPLAKGTGRIF